jgi:L-2,4-diaminobutyrate transaminase
MNHSEIRALDERTVLHPFSALRTQKGRDVIVLRSAKGIVLTDDSGREFIDAGSGLWCANVGYGRQELIDAATEQMKKISYSHSFSVMTSEPLVKLSERILAIAPSGMERVMYANSGSEANDTQIKLVWRYNNLRGKPNKKKIIARRGGYHGTSIGAGSMTGLDVVHRQFDLPIKEVLHTDAPEYYRRPADFVGDERAFSKHLAAQLDRMIETEGPDTVGAFIAEPIMGSAGVVLPPEGYFSEIRKVLDKHDVLLIVDEVITGFGRTGSWFASLGYDIQPDLMSIAKGLTSGYMPMSGCILSEKVCKVLYAETEADGYFGHGFTTSGHPVAAAVALKNIEIIDSEGLVAKSRERGEYMLAKLREKLSGAKHVGHIRGKGLMIGVEFDADPAERLPFKDVTQAAGLLNQACMAENLILRGGHGRVVAAIAPPLIVTEGEVDEIIARVVRVVEQFESAVPQLLNRK